MSQTNWEADKMLDVYIHDYLMKRELKASAQAFKAEAKVSSDPVAIDAPGGFLFEWWSVFWDIFIARTNEKHSEVATSYIETQLIKVREQQQPQQSQPQQKQLQMQQLLLQRHAQQQQQQQQQRREVLGPHHMNGLMNGLVGTDSLLRQNSSTVMAAQMYEEKLKLPQRSQLEDTEIKQRFRENAGQFIDPTETSMMKSAGPSSQPSEQVLHGDAGCMSPQVQVRGQQQPGPPPDLKNNLNPGLNPRAVGPEGPLIGIPGANQDGNNLTLKGWPLTGLDQLRSGLIQQQKPFNHAPQSFHNFQTLTPQHQQQLLLAQQNLTSSSANDLESRRLRMLLNSRNMSLGKDPVSNSAGDIIPNMGSPMQVNGVGLPRGDPDLLFKLKMAQMQQQNNQLQQQHSLLNLMSQNMNHNLHQQDTFGDPGAVDGAISNSYCGNNQTLKSQTGRKRKQVSSSGPANSTGTANTIAPSHSEAPSTPSTHTPGGDMMSIPALPHISNSSKPVMMFNANGSGSLASPTNQLQWDKDLESQAEMDRFMEDGVLENVESFLHNDDTDPGDTVGKGTNVVFSKVKRGAELD